MPGPEQGYDLLDPDHETKALEDLPKVGLQEGDDGEVHMRNMSYHRAASEEEALNLLFLGRDCHILITTSFTCIVHPRFLIQLTSYDVASNVCRALSSNAYWTFISWIK